MNEAQTPSISSLKSAEESTWAILSLLRFFLAMVVVLGHCCSFAGGVHDWTFIGLWLNQGSAVFGFFILSGYSIAASLERSPTGFYRRRFVRIWPLYIGCIIVGLLVSLRLPHGLMWPTGGFLPPATLGSILASVLMLQGIVALAIPVIGQIWSLSPEWWHYMFAPVLRRCSTIILLIFLVISFDAFMNIPTPKGGGPEGFNHGLSFLTLSWLWVTGFLYRRLDRQPLGAAVLIVPSVFALYFQHFTGIPLFISIFVLLLSAEFKVPARYLHGCNLLGDVSFPLYLFHMPVIALLVTFGITATAPIVAVALIASFAALYGIDYPSRVYFGPSAFVAASQLQPVSESERSLI